MYFKKEKAVTDICSVLPLGGKASKEVEKEQPVRWDKKPRRAWCPGSQENNKEEEGVIKNITKCCREIKTRVKRNPLCSVLCGQIQLEGGAHRSAGGHKQEMSAAITARWMDKYGQVPQRNGAVAAAGMGLRKACF